MGDEKSVRLSVLTQARLLAGRAPVGRLSCHGLSAGQVWERVTHDPETVGDFAEFWTVWGAQLAGVQLYVFPQDGGPMRKRVMAALVVAELQALGELWLVREGIAYRGDK